MQKLSLITNGVLLLALAGLVTACSITSKKLANCEYDKVILQRQLADEQTKTMQLNDNIVTLTHQYDDLNETYLHLYTEYQTQTKELQKTKQEVIKLQAPISVILEKVTEIKHDTDTIKTLIK